MSLPPPFGDARGSDVIRQFLRGIRSQWWLAAVAFLAVLQASIYFPLQPTRRIYSDTARFLLGGDLLAAGYAPYLNLWDLKPPLIYDLTGLLALIAPGDPWAQFYMASALTFLAALATVALAGGLIARVTNSSTAAFVTCVTIIGFNTFVVYPANAVSPKYFMLVCGLAALWCSLNDRHIPAAALATAAAGFWQWGLVFVVLVYARAWRVNKFAQWRAMVVASVAVTAVAVAPIVLAGAGAAMVQQVMIDVFIKGTQEQTLLESIQKFTRYLNFLWPLVVAGGFGAIEVATRKRDHYWVLALVVWAGFQVFFVDFETGPDLFMIVVFAALGLGVLIGTLRLQQHQRVLVVCLVLALAGGQLYDHRQALETPGPARVTADAQTTKGAFLGQRIPPDTCTISIGSDRVKRLYTDDTPQVCEPPGFG